MRLGLEVPRFYIIPSDRFSRDIGPSLGINLAEFEFPCYFNFFIRGKDCMLVVDDVRAEENIKSVFNETLFGPSCFRGPSSSTLNPKDFADSYDKALRPDFKAEFKHFRGELCIEKLISFKHFRKPNFEHSSEPPDCHHRNIIANSHNGVKVIKISVPEIDFVLRAGSPLYRSYRNVQSLLPLRIASGETTFTELLETNSALRRLTPIQKRHLEALSEERAEYDPGEYLWKRGSVSKYAFIVVKGSVHFGLGRRSHQRSVSCERYERHLEMQNSGSKSDDRNFSRGSTLTTIASMSSNDSADAGGGRTTMVRRATIATSRVIISSERRASDGSVDEEAIARMRGKRELKIRGRDWEEEGGGEGVIGRRYNRRAVNGMEVLSRGHFLANVAEMIVSKEERQTLEGRFTVGEGRLCGQGEEEEMERGGNSCKGTGRHSSTLRAGGNGATVVRFKKEEFILFLDKHPGVLLSLLGKEIVV